jgi:hypothetical protein
MAGGINVDPGRVAATNVEGYVEFDVETVVTRG